MIRGKNPAHLSIQKTKIQDIYFKKCPKGTQYNIQEEITFFMILFILCSS